MSAETISIIIPIKNRASLVSYTIESILNQTLKADEIILVDDDSSDNLDEVLLPYKEKIIFLKNNGVGPGAARNTGLKKATGTFIKFFDSDDLMSSNTLQTQVEILKKSNKAYVTSSYMYAKETAGQWESESGNILNYYNAIGSKPLQHWMIWGLFIPIPSMLFRKLFLEQVGAWPEQIITSEDWLYLWRIAEAEQFPAHTNACTFIYRLHTFQSTGSNLDTYTRDKEKFSILKSIEAGMHNREQYSWWERTIFRLKFYQMATVTNDPIFKKELFEAAGRMQILMWLYYRTIIKIGRMKTQSDWQPMHGVCSDVQIVSACINSFNLKK